jgi:hypothetical protein
MAWWRPRTPRIKEFGEARRSERLNGTRLLMRLKFRLRLCAKSAASAAAVSETTRLWLCSKPVEFRGRLTSASSSASQPTIPKRPRQLRACRATLRKVGFGYGWRCTQQSPLNRPPTPSWRADLFLTSRSLSSRNEVFPPSTRTSAPPMVQVCARGKSEWHWLQPAGFCDRSSAGGEERFPLVSTSRSTQAFQEVSFQTSRWRSLRFRLQFTVVTLAGETAGPTDRVVSRWYSIRCRGCC